LLFFVNTAEKYSGQKLKLFGTKSRKGYKPTHDDFFLHQNHLHIIFYYFIVFSHQYG